jgi:excinuclease ABC subunit B
LVDPQIDVRQAKNQVDDLFTEILIRQKRNERVLVTTLTKRLAEDLTEYYSDMGMRVRYLHAEIHTLERMDIIRDLRAGKFDVLIGINLLREGLDLPEVSLVAILDADKEGFLRSTRSLVQTCGRAARNVRGQVIMYADVVTASMKQAIDETNRRRKIQKAYNRRHGTRPKSIIKEVTSVFGPMVELEDSPADKVSETVAHYNSLDDMDDVIMTLKRAMEQAAKELAFERASEIRDQIKALKKLIVFEL